MSTNNNNHPKRVALKYWTIALILVCVGVYLSIMNVLDRDWISRAGCLIVVLGIWSGVGGLVQQKILLESLEYRRQKMIAAIWRKYWHSEEEREQNIKEVNQRFQERADQSEHKLELSVGILESSLLLTGTILWGFGGLFKYIL